MIPHSYSSPSPSLSVMWDVRVSLRECVSKYTWWQRNWGDSGVPQTCSREAAVPVPALEVGDRALSWGPLVLMRGMALTWVLSMPPPVLARGTRAGRVGQQVQYWWEEGLLRIG